MLNPTKIPFVNSLHSSQEDYLTGMKNGLELLSPVDDAGRFTEEAGERFVGKDVLGDGNLEAIAALDEVGALLMEEKVRWASVTTSLFVHRP